MSGQQERWNRLDLPDQPDLPDLPDSTLIMTQLLGRDRERPDDHHGNGPGQDSGPGQHSGPGQDSGPGQHSGLSGPGQDSGREPVSRPDGYLAADPGAGRHRSTRSVPAAAESGRPRPVTPQPGAGEAEPDRAPVSDLPEPARRAAPQTGTELRHRAEPEPTIKPEPPAEQGPPADHSPTTEPPRSTGPPRSSDLPGAA